MNNYFIYIAARGQGKTFLVALFCVIRCILFPGSKIVVCSGTLKQANEVLLKIQDEFLPQSWMIRSEISECNIGQNDSSIYFFNGSQIKARTSTANARSARANIIIVDEFRMVDKTIVDSVIREFLKAPRTPGFYKNDKYKDVPKERNKEIYMSSAQFMSSQIYKKCQTFTANMLDDTKRYFICGLPYQISIKEGLLQREQVEDQMSESDFNEITWKMEDEALFWSDTDGSFFRFDLINDYRKIKDCILPLQFYNDKLQIPPVPKDGHRLLSIDVALMASTKKKKNDASSIFINDLVKSDPLSYQSNFRFSETYEGLTTDDLGLIVMRYFYFYKCTDIVIDTNGRLMPF